MVSKTVIITVKRFPYCNMQNVQLHPKYTAVKIQLCLCSSWINNLKRIDIVLTRIDMVLTRIDIVLPSNKSWVCTLQ